MVESSRTFLFTEYARSICGTFKNQGTDPKVWDVLPVSLFNSPSEHIYQGMKISSNGLLSGQILLVSEHQGDPGAS